MIKDKILLVEDDMPIAASLAQFLAKEGFEVKNERGQREALSLLERESFDLILLDISIANGSGFDICSKVKADYDIPVIFLTASDDEGSTVAGFELGADDYISKPFRPRELAARIKNVLRRKKKDTRIELSDNTYADMERAVVVKHGQEIILSALEYKLLMIFIQNRGLLLSRNRLLEEIWDIGGDFVNDNTLTVYIKRLRERIEDDPANPCIIKTVRGLGYRMD